MVNEISLKTLLDEKVSYSDKKTGAAYSCDVAVIGAGGAGMCAAVRAAERGARVIVLEKAARIGGNSFMASIFQAINTAEDRAKGIDERDQVFKGTMMFRQGGVDYRTVWAGINVSGTVFDWLCEKGMHFDQVRMRGQRHFTLLKRHAPYENIDRDPSHGPGYAGSYVVENLYAQCEKLGIHVLTKTKAVQILTDSSGAVSGVRASTPEGELQIKAKAVVLASGGFAANDELVRTYFPDAWYPVGGKMIRMSNAHSTGDGIFLAQALGAKTMENVWHGVGAMTHHPYAFSLHQLVMQPENLIVNREGRRFVDEAAFGMDKAITIQPGAIAYILLDEEKRHIILKN